MTKEQSQERLKQCNKDIAALEAEKAKLEKEIEEKLEPKFGDVVTLCNYGDRRVMLYSSTGRLCAFNRGGRCVGSSLREYVTTGQNIFDILNLDL